MLHCLGLVLLRSGRREESIQAYRRAYNNYKETVGITYHRFGAVCGKIAEYHTSLNQFEAAEYAYETPVYNPRLANINYSHFFDEAYKAYTSHLHPHYLPELARHHFIQGESLERRGDHAAAQASRAKAQELYNKIAPQTYAAVLGLDVLNALVAPWVW